jgi:hypothetical protein
MSKKKSKLQRLKQKLSSLRPNKKVTIGLGIAAALALAVGAARLHSNRADFPEGCYATDVIPAIVMGRDQGQLVAVVPTPMGFLVPIIVDEGKFRAANPKRIPCMEVLNPPQPQK